MGQAKWYEMTPARRELLVALGIALLIFGAILGRYITSGEKLQEPETQQQPANNPGR
jgi:hypothetical protein